MAFVLAKEPNPPCVSPRQIAGHVLYAVPAAHEHTIRGTDAVDFTAQYNTLPPVSAFVADEAMIFTAGERDPILVYLFYKGCVIAWSEMPVYILPKLLGTGA